MNPERLADMKALVTIGSTMPSMHAGTPMWTIMGICLTWGDLCELVDAADRWLSSDLDPQVVERLAAFVEERENRDD